MLIPLLLTDYEWMLAYPYFSHMPSLPPQFSCFSAYFPWQRKNGSLQKAARRTVPSPAITLCLWHSGKSVAPHLPCSTSMAQITLPLSGFHVFHPDKLLLNKCLLTSINLALQFTFPAFFCGTDYILHPNILRCISHYQTLFSLWYNYLTSLSAWDFLLISPSSKFNPLFPA